jgi:hypothetical protein
MFHQAWAMVDPLNQLPSPVSRYLCILKIPSILRLLPITDTQSDSSALAADSPTLTNRESKM